MASKRDALVKAAKRLLWERGYEATSPRDIQDASGAGQGSFYHHFEGKLDLAAAAISEVAEEMHESATELLDPSIPGIERITRFLEQRRDGLKGCRLGRFASESSIAESKIRVPIKAYFEYLEELLANAFTDAQRDKAIRLDVDPRQMATLLIAVLQGGFVLSRIHRDNDAINRASSSALILLRSTLTRK